MIVEKIVEAVYWPSVDDATGPLLEEIRPDVPLSENEALGPSDAEAEGAGEAETEAGTLETELSPEVEAELERPRL